MDKTFGHIIRTLLSLLPLALLAASCGKQAGQDWGDGGDEGLREVTVTARFPAQTRANYTAALSDELCLGNGYLLIFDKSGKLEECRDLSLEDSWSFDRDSQTGTDVLRISGGTKGFCFLFNTEDPESLGIASESGLLAHVFSLSDEVPSSGDGTYRFQMWGYNKSIVPAGSEDPVSISVDVKRIAARVVLRSVTNSHPDGYDITLNRAWLSNVAADHAITGFSSSGTTVSSWYNIQGRSDRTESHIIDGSTYTADLPEMTYRDIGETVSNGTTYGSSSSMQLFYCYPNPSATSNGGFTPSFDGEYTVLVLDTTIDGVTHYFPVPLDTTPGGCSHPIESNYSYAVDVVISGNGSPDPNDPDERIPSGPVTADCQVTITVEDWVSGASYTETI